MHQTIDECYIYRAVVPAMRPKSAFEPPIPKTASNEVYNLSSLFCACTTWRWMKHEDVRCCNTHVSRGRQITRSRTSCYAGADRCQGQPHLTGTMEKKKSADMPIQKVASENDLPVSALLAAAYAAQHAQDNPRSPSSKSKKELDPEFQDHADIEAELNAGKPDSAGERESAKGVKN